MRREWRCRGGVVIWAYGTSLPPGLGAGSIGAATGGGRATTAAKEASSGGSVATVRVALPPPQVLLLSPSPLHVAVPLAPSPSLLLPLPL